MSQVLAVLRHVEALHINPLAVVVVAALLAALIEQRMTRRRTPDFNAAYRGIARPPGKAAPARAARRKSA